MITISGTIHGEVKAPQHFERSSLVQGTVTQYGNATYLKDGEPATGSQFFNFKLFGSENQINFFYDMAEEGKPVVLVGELTEEEFVNKEGETKKTRYVKVLRFDFPRAKGEMTSGSKSSSKSSGGKSKPVAQDDDDPFA